MIGPTISDVRLTRHRHWRAKLGMIVLAMEQTVESDLVRVAPEGVGIHVSRVPMSNTPSLAALEGTRAHLEQAASLILPEDTLDYLNYTCSSGSIVIGRDETCTLMANGNAGAKAYATAASAAAKALRAMGVKRPVVVTPYINAVNQRVETWLLGEGFQVPSLTGLSVRTNIETDMIDPGFLREIAIKLVAQAGNTDGVFFCCGAMRSLEIISDLEKELALPVISSNQAIIWDGLRSSGVNDVIQGYGMLLAER